jgi:hypothetical protein
MCDKKNKEMRLASQDQAQRFIWLRSGDQGTPANFVPVQAADGAAVWGHLL